jgi:hypothetical protein
VGSHVGRFVSPKQASTFEAITLAGLVWLAAHIALLLMFGIIAAVSGNKA